MCERLSVLPSVGGLFNQSPRTVELMKRVFIETDKYNEEEMKNAGNK